MCTADNVFRGMARPLQEGMQLQCGAACIASPRASEIGTHVREGCRVTVAIVGKVPGDWVVFSRGSAWILKEAGGWLEYDLIFEKFPRKLVVWCA